VAGVPNVTRVGRARPPKRHAYWGCCRLSGGTKGVLPRAPLGGLREFSTPLR